MKRCPACQKTYPDDQNFCLDDGTTLVGVIGGSYDSANAPTNYSYRSGSAPTEFMQPGTPTYGAGQGRTTPPPQFMPAYPPKRSNAVLWFVLGGVVLVGGIIAAVLLVNRSPGTTTTSGTTPGASPSYSPSSTPSGTPSIPSGEWQTVNGEGFTVTMPGTPSHETQDVASAVGPLKLHMYTVSHGFEAFMTGYGEYPEAVFNLSKPDDIFNGAQNGVITNIKGEVVSQRSVTLNGNPGREVVGKSATSNLGFTIRLYVVKPKLYMQFYTQYDKDKPASADGQKFLDSLQLK